MVASVMRWENSVCVASAIDKQRQRTSFHFSVAKCDLVSALREFGERIEAAGIDLSGGA
jgi:hypothetical protein